ncbi:hypothetical protein GQ53DRAFT_757186 [Thozetella sp. PMI_491]|nr:hypothetical protein GQ53DRAFT_757186 [Thozetella sp. PMI_491]
MTNATGNGHTAINLVAAIGFSAEEADPIAARFIGRPVRDTLDLDTLNRVTSWVKSCDEHRDCQPRGERLPLRLIDIGSTDKGGWLPIVYVDKYTVTRYIALSHCYRHRDIAQANLLPMSQDKVEFAALSKTFQDAILVTRNLGVKYLWIDALCITLQGAKDWARDSANIGAVFANAYLTLAATGAKDMSEGLFLKRKPREYIRVDYMVAGKIEGKIMAYALPLDKEAIDRYYLDMRSEPLSQDIWAFQDRALSPRTLHFASDQIYLECQEGFISEDGLNLPQLSTHGGFRFGRIPQDKGQAISAWYGMLRDYSQRFHKNPHDKLSAIANLARAYAEILEDEYIAGLWKQHLVESLTWQSLGHSQDLAQSSAPSWSWASFGGLVTRGRRESRTWKPIATVLDYHIEPEGHDRFGNVKEAWIKIGGPLIPLQVSEETGPTGHIYLRSPKGDKGGEYAGLDFMDRSIDKSGSMIKAMKLSCLWKRWRYTRWLL